MKNSFPINLYIYEMNQDDPKKCSAKKLFHHGLVKKIYPKNRIPQKAIVLNPLTRQVLSPNDKIYYKYGIIAIDASWKRIDEVFYHQFKGINRRLPYLIPSNPINYGKISFLSSAEALAASLYIINNIEKSEKILSIFKWGHEFFKLNEKILEEYKSANNVEEILAIEKKYFPYL